MKKQIIDNRTVLEADEGKLITNGDALYCSKLWLECGISESELFEITIEEYREKLKE